MRDTSPPYVDETRVEHFESAWIRGEPPRIETSLPDRGDSRYLPTLEELVLIDLEFAWKSHPSQSVDTAGQGAPTAKLPSRVEQYLARFPELNDHAVLLRLLQQEYRMRCRFADPISLLARPGSMI